MILEEKIAKQRGYAEKQQQEVRMLQHMVDQHADQMDYVSEKAKELKYKAKKYKSKYKQHRAQVDIEYMPSLDHLTATHFKNQLDALTQVPEPSPKLIPEPSPKTIPEPSPKIIPEPFPKKKSPLVIKPKVIYRPVPDANVRPALNRRRRSSLASPTTVFNIAPEYRGDQLGVPRAYAMRQLTETGSPTFQKNSTRRNY